MKIMIALAATAAAIALAGCGGLPGTGGSNFDINAFLNSPTCAHKDSVNGVTGAAGIPASLQFSASRDCPAAVPAAPITSGQTVGVSTDPGPTPH